MIVYQKYVTDALAHAPDWKYEQHGNGTVTHDNCILQALQSNRLVEAP